MGAINRPLPGNPIQSRVETEKMMRITHYTPLLETLTREIDKKADGGATFPEGGR